MLSAAQPDLTWNLVTDVRQVFEFPFMVNAFRAGTIAAVLCALVGWFMVLRGQSFAGHTLAVVGFPGAAGAVLLGVSATLGYFTFGIVAALVIGLVTRTSGRGYSEESAVTGTVQALALGSGFLFVSLYGGFLGGVNALLFGSFLGITRSQVLVLLVVAVVALAALAAVARPLLFASLDPAVAAARGVPTRLLSIGFLVLLAVAAGEAAQITGALLVFALLVVPPAAAQTVTAHPGGSIALAVVVGLLVVWLSLFVAYYAPYPIGFLLTSLAFIAYLLARGWRALRSRQDRRGVPA